jgi:ubiquinone/menaquinone biosynthesis C-methylase UbiE
MSKFTPPVCDYENSRYQEEFWEQGGRDYEDLAEKIALKRLLPRQGRLLLEVGAGAGRNTPRYRGYEKIVLLDYSLTQLQQARERLGKDARLHDRCLFVAGNAYSLPFTDQTFDGATMIRTLHHMQDAPASLREIYRVLQPGGAFLLEYANKHNLKAILRYLMGRQDWSPFSPEPVEFVELNFDFHPRTIRQWLKEIGFTVKRQLTVSHFRVPLLKRLFPTRLLGFLDSIAQLTGNWWQLSPSVFVLNRIPGELPSTTAGVIFRCPACGTHPLQEEENALICPTCQAAWAIRDGIYDFRG